MRLLLRHGYHSLDKSCLSGKCAILATYFLDAFASCSYRSVVSAGGTKTKVRKQRIRDADGKVIGHGKEQIYVSGSCSF